MKNTKKHTKIIRFIKVTMALILTVSALSVTSLELLGNENSDPAVYEIQAELEQIDQALQVLHYRRKAYVE